MLANILCECVNVIFGRCCCEIEISLDPTTCFKLLTDDMREASLAFGSTDRKPIETALFLGVDASVLMFLPLSVYQPSWSAD